MVDVVSFGEKVLRTCALNKANNRDAPHSKTELVAWLGLGGGSLSKRYKDPVADLQAALERAVVMALGFGPDETEFERYDWATVWTRWALRWGEVWRNAEAAAFSEHLEQEDFFFPRQKDDPRLAPLLSKIRRPKKDGIIRQADQRHAAPAAGGLASARATSRARYLDRLASLQVVCDRSKADRDRLVATFTFGEVEIATEDATYLVAVNRCHAEIFLADGSFDPTLEEQTVDSRSPPVRQMKIKRESSRLNHPTWLVCDTHSKTPLWGEYCDLSLGVVNGGVSEKDEASLLVHKAEFAVSALSGPGMPEQGILGGLLRYLVTEHVGEIEQTNNYLYRLSAGPIQNGEDDA